MITPQAVSVSVLTTLPYTHFHTRSVLAMPHVAIKYFPRNLPETVKQDLANDISDLLKKYLNAEDKSISVALTEVTPDRWKDTVYDIEIGPELDNLTKKPGYSM
jgi:4-oxalocrotonate tautomerase